MNASTLVFLLILGCGLAMSTAMDTHDDDFLDDYNPFEPLKLDNTFASVLKARKVVKQRDEFRRRLVAGAGAPFDDDDDRDFDRDDFSVVRCPANDTLGPVEFSNAAPFDVLGNPQCGDVVQPEMRLYMRGFLVENKQYCELMLEGMMDTKFCLGMLEDFAFDIKKVVFVVHGYMGHITDKWMEEANSAIMTADDDTAVVVVGWFAGDRSDMSASEYKQTAANTRYMGMAIKNATDMIRTEFTEVAKVPLPSVHCIGHSLGAHVCAFGGKLLAEAGRPLDRITGLDPAGPMFFDDNSDPFDNMNITAGARLNTTDAHFVDVIHTDGVMSHQAGNFLFPLSVPQFGTMVPCGTVDFYPGHSPHFGHHQPGCPDSSVSSCSHSRSHEFFLSSFFINSDCPTVSECTDVHGTPNTEDEPVWRGCRRMARGKAPTPGYWIKDRRPGLYQVNYAGKKKPFCPV